MDRREVLWSALREGVVRSADVTQSGRLKPAPRPLPEPTRCASPPPVPPPVPPRHGSERHTLDVATQTSDDKIERELQKTKRHLKAAEKLVRYIVEYVEEKS